MIKLFGFWPGVTDLLKYGRWTHLLISLLFALILDFYLFFNYYWTDFFSDRAQFWQLIGIIIAWLVLSGWSFYFSKTIEKNKNQDKNGDLFLESLTHYLRGNWFETECCLKSLLRKNPSDAEAVLLLATMFRHTQRFSEAAEALQQLERMETADRWFYEILIEKKELKASAISNQ
ncbi:MAG: hypothetical protein Q4C95_10320 [Planctomycetia bacterium]|nr:hypothetical protein [Planctomycetia bacterium]